MYPIKYKQKQFLFETDIAYTFLLKTNVLLLLYTHICKNIKKCHYAQFLCIRMILRNQIVLINTKLYLFVLACVMCLLLTLLEQVFSLGCPPITKSFPAQLVTAGEHTASFIGVTSVQRLEKESYTSTLLRQHCPS